MKKTIMIILLILNSTFLYSKSFEQNGVIEGNNRLSMGLYGEKEYIDNISKLNIKFEGTYGSFISNNSEILLKVRDSTDLKEHKYKLDIAYSFYFFKKPIFTPYVGVELGIAGNTRISKDKVVDEQGIYVGFHHFFSEHIALTPEVGIEFMKFDTMSENYVSLYLSYFFN